MRQNLVIAEKAARFTLRINDSWHRHRSYGEAVAILQNAGLNAHRLLCEAIRIPDPVHLEYQPNGWGRRNWLVNGKPQPVAVVRYVLSEAGCNSEIVAALIHAEKVNWEIQEWLKRC